MGHSPDARRISSFIAFSKVAAVFTVAVGLLAMLGWAFGISAFKSVRPGLVSMKANSAVAFIMLGLGLWLHFGKGRRIPPYLAAAAVLIGALTLCEYAFDWNLGIDQLLFKEPLGTPGTPFPGRMAPSSALIFVLAGLALLLLDWQTRASRFLASLSLLPGSLAFIGYAYGVTVFHNINRESDMALNTAITLVIFSLGVICARPESGIVAVAASDTSGAAVIREILPVAIGIAFIIGWLVSLGERAGYLGATEGSALYVVMLMIVLTSLAVTASLKLHRTDIRRRKTEEALRETKDSLEIRVRERTAELERTVTTLQEEVVDRLRAEEATAAERQQFNDVLETLPAYLVLLTPDYHVPFANRFFRERFGESLGRRCYEYLFGRSEPCEICETYNALKNMAPHRWEWTGPDGRIYDIYDFPFTDTDGSTLIMEMGIDITERKQAETELEKHRDHLEDLVRSRTDELETANTQLHTEIAEREKAEEALRSQVRSLQRALLPPEPLVIEGYRLAHAYIPAFAGEEIGGDFYDVFHTEHGNIGILIGDVSGKGIQAAAMAAGTRSAIRAFAHELSSPAEAMSHANRLLTAQQGVWDSFVTVLLLILDPRTGDTTFCSAGHPPALVRRANGDFELFAGANVPLGVINDNLYDQAAGRLDPGDKIVLYTDGITEARRGPVLFGADGIQGVLAEHGGEEPQALVEQIISGARAFADGRLRDDTAVLVMERIAT